ncbi:hypothetical protein R6Q59_006582 [Mikania micrantha]
MPNIDIVTMLAASLISLLLSQGRYNEVEKPTFMESMSDKSILEKVLGRSFIRFHGWGRDPTICSNATGTNQKSKHITYNELVDEVETLKEHVQECNKYC